MAIKMIATRRHYSKPEGKEYEPGQEFSVETQREADRLVMRRRARISDTMRAETPAPKRRGRPPKAETEAGTYFRSDMRAED